MKIRYTLRAFGIVALMLFVKASYAQNGVPDNMGQALQKPSFTYTEGSPFFMDEWDNGMVKMDDGTTFNNVQLKYNDLDVELYFKNSSGKDFVFTQPVHEFTLYTPKSDSLKEHHFRNGYAASRDPRLFYEVLCDGPVQLLKINSKQGQESQDNSSVVTHRIINATQYFLLISGRLVAMKKDRKFIYQNLGNKTKEMSDFADKNNLNIKDDKDIIKLINFYNSI